MSATQLTAVANAVSSTVSTVNSQYLPQVIGAQQDARVEAHQSDWSAGWELDQNNGVGSVNIQAGYQSLADGLFSSGKYASRGDANEAAVKYMLQ